MLSASSFILGSRLAVSGREGIERLKSELRAAVERDRLHRKTNRIEREIGRLRSVGAGKDGDPQVGLLSRVFNVERDGLTLWINVFIAIVIELGSDFGLFFSTSRGGKGTAKKSQCRDGDKGSSVEHRGRVTTLNVLLRRAATPDTEWQRSGNGYLC